MLKLICAALALALTSCAWGQAERYAALETALAKAETQPVAAGHDDVFVGDKTLERQALVRAVLARNPTVESARHGWRATLAAYPQVSALDDPLIGRVPFYLQESLGGSHTLRGFDSFRFRGEKVILGQAEYRWLAAPPIELAVFYDIGTVSAPGEDLDFDDPKSNWGVGLRIKNFRTTLVRLDYARSFETSVFMFRVSSSF